MGRTIRYEQLPDRGTSLFLTVLDHHLRRLPALGVGGNPHGQFTRFDRAFHVDIPKSKFILGQGEFHAASLARGKGYFLKSFQFPDRAGDAGPTLANVKLHDFAACRGPEFVTVASTEIAAILV